MYYTLFNPGILKKAAYTYDGTKLSFGAHVLVSATPRADGVINTNDGGILVGGTNHKVYKIDLTNPDPNTNFTGVKTGKATGGHVVLDPSGKSAWTSGMSGAAVASAA